MKKYFQSDKVTDSFIATKSYQQLIHARTFMLFLQPGKKDATMFD